MADVAIDTSLNTTAHKRCMSRWVVTTDASIVYFFYVDGTNDLSYRKSIDGGATLGDVVVVQVGTCFAFDTYFDKWAPSETGGLIHIALIDSAGTDRLSYYNLDVSDDSLSTRKDVATITVNLTAGFFNSGVTIAKSRDDNGNLGIQFWGDAVGSRGFYTSTDDGANWTSRTDGADGDLVDIVMLFPGNETDVKDFRMLYGDVSATELTMKVFDDSANTWSESAAIKTDVTFSDDWWQIAGAVDHTDGLIYGACHVEIDTTGDDIFTFTVDGTASITAKTDVVTNKAESGNVCLMINQQNQDKYVGYNVGDPTWAATTKAVFHKSTDNMSTWGTEQAMQVDTSDDEAAIACPSSVDDDGGLFIPVWFNDDLNDLFTNSDNAVSIAAAGVGVSIPTLHPSRKVQHLLIR